MVIQDGGVFVARSLEGYPTSAFGWVPRGLLIFAIVVVWLLVARTTFSKEDAMDQPSRVGQLYGYTICLVAVLIGVFSAQSLITNTVTLVSPGATLQPTYYGGPSLSSFEVYRETREHQEATLPPPGGASPKADTLTTEVLRSRFDALRADRLASERATAVRSLISSALFLALAVVLFVVQWRWLARGSMRKPESA